MTQNGYDIVTVGGGIAASTLAITMARKARAFLFSSEKRIQRSSARRSPRAVGRWGSAAARNLRPAETIMRSRAAVVRCLSGPHQLMHRDLLATTPQRAPVWSFYHPRMQEVLITAAAEAGADIRRGATVAGIDPGSQPVVRFQSDGRQHEVRTRLIAVAAGRVSVARKWAGFTVEHNAPTLLLAGVLFDNVPVPEDLNYIMTNPMSYQGAYMFPQGNGRVRTYFAYPHRLQGEADIPHFIDACVKAGVPAEHFRASNLRAHWRVLKPQTRGWRILIRMVSLC
jgi:flavin-dependent dehydrogenase